VEARQSGHGRRCSWWQMQRLSGSGATVKVLRRLGFSVGRNEMRAALFIYIGRRQATPWRRKNFVRRGRRRPRGTQGITICVAADCRSDTSAPVLTPLRRRIESRSLPDEPNKTFDRRDQTLCASA
jgi:hypothetical protein